MLSLVCVLQNVVHCGISQTTWQWIGFKSKGCIDSLETSWFWRFVGRPTEAWLAAQLKSRVGSARAGWLLLFPGLTWKFSRLIGCCSEKRIPGWDLGSWVATLQMEVQSLYHHLVMGEREWEVHRTFPTWGSGSSIFMSARLCYRLPLNLIILKALNKTMHAILRFFVSVNKLMLGSFVHSHAVDKTDFWQYFLHCFLSVFITSYLHYTGPSCYCVCSHCQCHGCEMFHMCLYKCEIFILTFFFFFIKDIYWFTYAINLFLFPEKNSCIFSLLYYVCLL